MKSLLLFIAVSLASAELSEAQVIVNPDGTHSVQHGNIIVNPDGTHSVQHGNILVNPDGTHSIIPITSGSGNLLHHNSRPANSQFGQWFINLFSKKDKAKAKQAREDRQRARGKFSVKRFGNVQ